MGLPKFRTKISVEDYLEGEKVSKVRHEFVNGEVYAMEEASENHYFIIANILKKLSSHLKNSNLEPFIVNMKLRADEKTFYYPDLFVATDKSPLKELYLYREKPILIVEVISEKTERIDRREKFNAYDKIPTVQEYLVIEQEKVHIELHRRQPDGNWITYFYNKSDFDEIIEFQSVGMEITLDEIYRRVKFD